MRGDSNLRPICAQSAPNLRPICPICAQSAPNLPNLRPICEETPICAHLTQPRHHMTGETGMWQGTTPACHGGRSPPQAIPTWSSLPAQHALTRLPPSRLVVTAASVRFQAIYPVASLADGRSAAKQINEVSTIRTIEGANELFQNAGISIVVTRPPVAEVQRDGGPIADNALALGLGIGAAVGIVVASLAAVGFLWYSKRLAQRIRREQLKRRVIERMQGLPMSQSLPTKLHTDKVGRGRDVDAPQASARKDAPPSSAVRDSNLPCLSQLTLTLTLTPFGSSTGLEPALHKPPGP